MEKFFTYYIKDNSGGVGDSSSKQKIEPGGTHSGDHVPGDENTCPPHGNIYKDFKEVEFIGKKTFVQNTDQSQPDQYPQHDEAGKSFYCSGDKRSISSGDEQINRTMVKFAGSYLLFFTAAEVIEAGCSKHRQQREPVKNSSGSESRKVDPFDNIPEWKESCKSK